MMVNVGGWFMVVTCGYFRADGECLIVVNSLMVDAGSSC